MREIVCSSYMIQEYPFIVREREKGREERERGEGERE